MATQESTEYANGRVITTTFTNDEGAEITQVNTYTIGSYDYSKIPDKPTTITDPTWWDVAHYGQESSLNPNYFADSFFNLRGYTQPTPDRPTLLRANTLSRSTFNTLKL